MKFKCGHPYTPKNTNIVKICRVCQQKRERKSHLKRYVKKKDRNA